MGYNNPMGILICTIFKLLLCIYCDYTRKYAIAYCTADFYMYTLQKPSIMKWFICSILYSIAYSDTNIYVGGNIMRKVTENMIIREVLELDEGTAPIFMQYGMHCLFCPSASGESIKQACAVHGIESEKLIADLNEYLSSKQ